jgi:hypothetical protein
MLGVSWVYTTLLWKDNFLSSFFNENLHFKLPDGVAIQFKNCFGFPQCQKVLTAILLKNLPKSIVSWKLYSILHVYYTYTKLVKKNTLEGW